MPSLHTTSFGTSKSLIAFDVKAAFVELNTPAMETVVSFWAFDSEAFPDFRRHIALTLGNKDTDVLFLAFIEAILLGG